jgi:hypothetical protein
MSRLTLENFYRIWESEDFFQKNFPKITLYYNKSFKGGNLWYEDSKTGKTIYIAEGSFELIYNEDDSYQLNIGESKFDLRLYMSSDEYSSFDMRIPEFGYLRFIANTNLVD